MGFSIGGKEITADLKKLKYSTNPYNINRLTLLAGEASIDDEKYFRDNINKIIENREYTSKELKIWTLKYYLQKRILFLQEVKI